MNLRRYRVASESLSILLCMILITPGCISLGPCKKGNCVDGYGVRAEQDGSIYSGEFKGGLHDGIGEQNWTRAPIGGQYQGLYSGAQRGTWKWGQFYAGTWTVTTVAGKATRRFENGVQTKLIMEYTNGDQAEHTYRNGTLAEQKYIFKNGNIYTGEFRNGDLTGTGTMTFPNGKKYTGEWDNGQPIPGRGAWYSADGALIKTPNGVSMKDVFMALGILFVGAIAVSSLGGGSDSGTSAHTPTNQGPRFENDWRQKCKVYAGTNDCTPGSPPGSLE